MDSYVGWYDPFCELIQNALDSIDERISLNNEPTYIPLVRVIINIQDNSVIVSDNGTGLTKEKYEQFLAPSFSFKSGKSRGHKGVGATYLAYGFNSIQISTKTEGFSAVGKMLNARNWLNDENPSGNPKVQPDPAGSNDKVFDSFDIGVSIYLKFDKDTNPGDLKWIKANTAEQWFSILSIKTGLGAFFKDNTIKIQIIVKDEYGNETEKEYMGIAFYWAHLVVNKAQRLRDLRSKADQLFSAKGRDFKMPASLTNLDAIYDTLDTKELESVELDLTESDKEVIQKYHPKVYFCYMYSAKVWSTANENLKMRQGLNIFSPGIQIAANNMPQGEIVQIPLTKNIGRQNQMQVVIHFDNCRGDLGRKGFQKEIIEFGKSMGRKLIEKPISKFRYTLRPITGVKDDLARENAIDRWKDEMAEHEQQYPLRLVNENFFLPLKQIAITSIPTENKM